MGKLPVWLRISVAFASLVLGRAAEAVPVGAASFVGTHMQTDQLDPWVALTVGNLPQVVNSPDLRSHAQTVCALRLDADPGDPADAPATHPTNRITFSTAIQCDTYGVHAYHVNGTEGAQVEDRGYQIEKEIISLELHRESPLGGSGRTLAAVPPPSWSNYLSASGISDIGPVDSSAVFRVYATVRLTDRSSYSGFSPNAWFAVGSRSPTTLVNGGNCENLDSYLTTAVQERSPFVGSSIIECTVVSPPFTLADIDGRHFLASGSKFYNSCSFNSKRANIPGGAAHINFIPSDAWGPVSPNSTVVFSDPSATCTTNNGSSWDTVPIEFTFKKTGIDPCGSQKLADTQVLKGTLRINGGPTIPAKLLVQVTPLGPFDPIIHVVILNDFSIDSPTSSTPTGQYLDAPASQAPVLNDEVESIANLYSYLLPKIAPAFGSNIYSVNIGVVGKEPIGPISANLSSPLISTSQDPKALACDRREVRFDFAGTLREPGKRDGQVSLGSGLSVDTGGATEVGPAFQASGQAIDSSYGTSIVSVLGSLADLVQTLPTLPVVPPIPYTISVEYLNPLYPTYSSQKTKIITLPAVYGVPTVVPIPVVGADQFVVTLGSTNQLLSVKTLTQANGGDYMLRIQKVTASKVLSLPSAQGLPSLPVTGPSIADPLSRVVNGCVNPTPVNITAKVGLKELAALTKISNAVVDSLLDSVNDTAISIGYVALNATSAPTDFALVFQQYGDAGFSVHEGVEPCVAVDPLTIQASYVKDKDRQTAINVSAEMAPAVQSFAFSSLTLDDNVKWLNYTGSSPMTRFTASGSYESTNFDVRLRNLTNASACQHDGNLCNVAWRMGKESSASFDLKSWDNNGDYSPVGIYVYTAPPGAYPSTFDVELSSLAVDTKLQNFNHALDNFGGYGLVYDGVQRNYYHLAYSLSRYFVYHTNFPYWFYLNTDWQNVKGALSTPILSATAPVGFSASNRELVLDRYLFAVWLHDYGSINCGDISFVVNGAGFTAFTDPYADAAQALDVYYNDGAPIIVPPVTVGDGAISDLIRGALCHYNL